MQKQGRSTEETTVQGLPWSPVVNTLLALQGARVQLLVILGQGTKIPQAMRK